MAQISSSPIALTTSIVKALEAYGEIPLDFLAKVVGHRTQEVREYVDALADDELVEIEGDRVRLTPQAANH